MKMTVFWDVKSCFLVGSDRRFRRTYCINYESDGSLRPDDGSNKYL
jgi:hypothetical protein